MLETFPQSDISKIAAARHGENDDGPAMADHDGPAIATQVWQQTPTISPPRSRTAHPIAHKSSDELSSRMPQARHVRVHMLLHARVLHA